MRGVPLGIFKILQNRRNFRLTCHPVSNALGYTHRAVLKNPPSEVNETVFALKRQSSPIHWEEITKKLAKKYVNVHKIIYQSCLELKDSDISLSYYKYLLDKGENLNKVTLFTIVHMLSQCSKKKILERQDLIIHLYNQCKELMKTSEILQHYGMQLFPNIPFCFRDLLPLVKANDISKKDYIISRAFDFDEKEAWELLESSQRLSEGNLNSFIRFCIKKAVFKEFSVDILHKFVDLCQKKGFVLVSNDIICCLQPLIHVLNYCQNDYVWSVKKCIVNPQMECLNCNTFLKEVKLTQNEFKSLKEAVEKFVIFDKDVFLKTTEGELNYFKFFLKNCRPYDLVVDGLNFLYRGINSYKTSLILHLFEKFVKQKKKNVLIIGRKHLQTKTYFDNIPNVQFFYTGNLSDDDIFTLHAALLGGLGTGIITSDFFTAYSAKLSPEMKTLFIKWQLSHQYIFNLKFGVLPPSLHVGLPQCTEKPEMGGNSYKWHLTYQNNTSQYSFRLNFDWVCLQATPKNKRKIKNLKS